MDKNFEAAVNESLNFEGGYVNNPNDAGGETKYGITAGTLARAYKAGIVSHNSVKDLTIPEAKSIYKAFYWNASGCDALPEPVDVIVFDAAIHCGVGGASKFLQSAVAWLTGVPLLIDGDFGPKSRGALSRLVAVNDRLNATMDAMLAKDALVKALGMAVIAERDELFVQITDGINANPARRAQEVKNRTFLLGWFRRTEALTDTHLGI